MSTYKVRYVNFWNGFNPNDFLVTKILHQNFGSRLEVVSDYETSVDLEIGSVFHFNKTSSKIFSYLLSNISEVKKFEYISKKDFGFANRKNLKAKKTLWYTGENLRHPSGVFSGTLSFDKTDLNDNNYYLPYWMVALDWSEDPTSGELSISNLGLMKSRNPDYRDRTACSFSSTLEPSRVNLQRAVARSMKVDSYGRAHGRWVENKHEVAQKYGFQICSENDLYPGYVTEKLIDAWNSQTIPIWTGLDAEKYFNSEAILDFTRLNCDEIFERLEALTEKEVLEMRSAPILKRMPTIKPIVSFLEKVIYG